MLATQVSVKVCIAVKNVSGCGYGDSDNSYSSDS